MSKTALIGFGVTALAVVAGLYAYQYLMDSKPVTTTTTTPPPAVVDPATGMAFRGRR